MSDKPFVNLGAGRIILPCPRPNHHQLVDHSVYELRRWVNADRNPEPGIDVTVDLFSYPWPFEDNQFGGALASHICEHIPHRLSGAANGQFQDGWYAWFSELYRVLEPGAIAHILSPYAWSAGAMTDPTHTRYLTEHTFTHSMQPDPTSPFFYQTGGIHFEMVEPARFSITEMFRHLAIADTDDEHDKLRKHMLFEDALMTRINVAYELYVKLRAVKE